MFYTNKTCDYACHYNDDNDNMLLVQQEGSFSTFFSFLNDSFNRNLLLPFLLLLSLIIVSIIALCA